MGEIKLCDYGCGKEAKYQFKNGKWCCSEIHTKCSGFIKKRVGQKRSMESRKRMSKAQKGYIPWNKGKKTGQNNWLGKQHTTESKNKISNSKKLTIIQIKKRYPIFAKIEKMRYYSNMIQVHCKNHLCSNSKEQDGWFTPTYIQLYERIRQIENGNGGSYLYCSQKCKDECPLYYLKNDPNKDNIIIERSHEYQTWRNEVLKRADYLCEYCEEPATDSHHSRPQKLEPGFVLDPDFGVACCEKCHYKYGHKDECSTGNLSVITCKEK